MENSSPRPDIGRLIEESLEAPAKPQWPPPAPGQRDRERGDLPLEPALFEQRTEEQKRHDLSQADRERQQLADDQLEFTLRHPAAKKERPRSSFDDLKNRLKSGDGVDDRELMTYLRATAEKLASTEPKLAAAMVRLGMESAATDAPYVLTGIECAIERMTENFRYDKLNQLRQLILSHESAVGFDDMLRTRLASAAQEEVKRVQQRQQIKKPALTNDQIDLPPEKIIESPITSVRLGVGSESSLLQKMRASWRKLIGR